MHSVFSRDITRGLLIFGLSLAYFVWLAAPTLTWVNTDADGIIYLHAAQYFTLAHPTGAPAFNLLNQLILSLVPWFDPFWTLSLVSVVASSLTAVLLFHTTGRTLYGTTRRSLIPSLIFLASGTVVSQSTILETYGLITLIMVAQYHWRRSPWIVTGLAVVGIGVHHLIALSFLPIVFWYWQNKWSLKPFLLAGLGGLWYLYIPLFNNEPRIFVQGTGIRDYISYITSQGRLIGGLAVLSSDIFTRIPDVLTIYFGGFLVAAGAVLFGLRNNLTSWLFALPFAHYAFAMPHLQYIWAMPAFAFGGLIAWRYVRDRIDFEIDTTQQLYRGLRVAIVAGAIVGIAFNLYAYDIGGPLLDANHTAVAYRQELDTLPPNSVIWTSNRSWEHMTTVYHNRETGSTFTNLRPHQLYGGGQAVQEITGMSLQESLLVVAATELTQRPVFKTMVLHPSEYSVELVPATAEEIWPELTREIFWPYQAPDGYEWEDFGGNPTR